MKGALRRLIIGFERQAVFTGTRLEPLLLLKTAYLAGGVVKRRDRYEYLQQRGEDSRS